MRRWVRFPLSPLTPGLALGSPVELVPHPFGQTHPSTLGRVPVSILLVLGSPDSQELAWSPFRVEFWPAARFHAESVPTKNFGASRFAYCKRLFCWYNNGMVGR